MKKERRIFSAEFKQEAVALVVEQGYSCAAAGRSLGVRGTQSAQHITMRNTCQFDVK
jgi:transposase-like protein